MRFFNKTLSSCWTSIRTTNHGTSVASVERTQGKPLIKRADVFENDIYAQEFSEILVQQFGLKKSPCSIVLGPSDYHLYQVDRPNVPQEEQKQAVRWKLKDMLDYRVEEASVDVIDIPKDQANQSAQNFVYAAAARNELIGSLSNRFIGAGLQLKAIDIQEMAQRNIAKLLEEPERGLAILSFTHSGGLLTFTYRGELFHARRIEMDEERTANAFERIALEVQRSLDHTERVFSFISLSKLVLAPFSEIEAFHHYLREYLYLPVEKLNFQDVFDLDSSVDLGDYGRQASLLPAIGGALREELTA